MSVILGSTGVTFPDATTQTTAATASVINVQTFTSSGTWTKPSLGASSRVLIQAWGGGGSGAKVPPYTGGGGGGGYNERWLTLSSMGATETITIGAGGAGVTTASTSGNVGGTTTAGSWVSAYGGGGGASSYGGGGGGQLSAGNSSGVAGSPWTYIQGDNSGTLSNTSSGSVYLPNGWIVGGAGAPSAGNSVWGGGGGGAYSGTLFAPGTSSYAGAGGAGGNTTSGTAGTAPSGGGGGTVTGTASGAGAAGQVIITVFPG